MREDHAIPETASSELAPKKRVLLDVVAYGASKTSYLAAKVIAYGGDRIWLQTPYGDHVFSRADGRWIEGPCLNLENSSIHQFELFEAAIQAGNVGREYEWPWFGEPGPKIASDAIAPAPVVAP